MKSKRKLKKGWLVTALLAIVAITVAIIVTLFNASNSKKQATAIKEQPKVETLSIESTGANKDDFFKVEKISSNMFGNLIPTQLTGKPDQVGVETLDGNATNMVKQTLIAAAKNPTTLAGVARAYISRDVKMPEKMTTTIDGQEYLSPEAQELWAEVWTHASKTLTDKDTAVVNSIPVSGYTDGMDKNGAYFVDSRRRDFSTENGLRFKNSKGEVVYQDADCGNFVWETPPKGVPQKPANPQSFNPQPPAPTPDPDPTPDPKNPSLDPAVQGNAPVGGGRNASSTIEEPADNTAPSFSSSYQAPAPPTATTPSTTTPSAPPANTGGGNAGIVNAPSGSFDDSNGRTVVDPGGGVTTPSTSYDPLVGQTPPPVENGNTSNSGVNNGSADANSIPMDD